jgi:ParB/RepB/Spo0J family partition protein
MTAATANIALSDIKVGKRIRQDMGDIAGLAANIAEIGLLHPIVVRPDGKLIAGERRIKAYEELGKSRIPATIVDLDKVVRGEYAENTFRKSLTMSEAADIADAIEPIERARAKERQGERIDKHPAKFARSSEGRALDKVGRVVGEHRDTINKARAVRDAAKAQPEKFGKLLADMDRTGHVEAPFRRLKIIEQATAIRAEPPSLPGNGPYRVIVADPPWPYEKRQQDPSSRAIAPYPTMSIAQICAVNVAALAHDDCILWLWSTNHHLRECFGILDAWGFQQKTILTWAKDRMGMGDWLRGQTEQCLLAVRGKPIVTLTNQTTLLHAPVRGHSVKPVEFYDLVEKLCPAPRYADLFSRYQHNDRWDCHGDEAPLMNEAAE